MKLPEELKIYHEPLESLQKLISRFSYRGVVIGGIAASVLGQARYTEDLDAMILLSTKDIPQFLEAAKQEGIEPRIEFWIKTFAELLETPELWGQIEKILKQQE